MYISQSACTCAEDVSHICYIVNLLFDVIDGVYVLERCEQDATSGIEGINMIFFPYLHAVCYVCLSVCWFFFIFVQF